MGMLREKMDDRQVCNMRSEGAVAKVDESTRAAAFF